MDENKKDTLRATRAARRIFDGRLPHELGNEEAVLFTLEQTVATVLLALYTDPRKAVLMMNEALVPRIEERIAMYAAKYPK